MPQMTICQFNHLLDQVATPASLLSEIHSDSTEDSEWGCTHATAARVGLAWERG